MDRRSSLLLVTLFLVSTFAWGCLPTFKNTGVEAQRNHLREQLASGTITPEQFSEQMRTLDGQSHERQ